MSRIPWESFRTQGFNAPNRVTYVRILASWIPACLLVAGFHNPGLRWWAAVIFIVVAATDGLDGWLARRYDLRSEWGEFIDPIADKLLVTTSTVALCVMYMREPFGWVIIFASVLFALRELVLAAQIARVQRGVVPPTWSGKVKTVFQMAMIAAWMAPFDGPFGYAAMALLTNAAIIMTLTSWIDYYRLYVSKTAARRM